MSPIIFKYKVDRGVPVPVVALAMEWDEKWYPVDAFVDTGATFSIFNAGFAEKMKLEYKLGKRKYIQVGDGSFIPIYLYDVQIQLGGYRLTVPIGFSDKLGVRFNLLGREGLFANFRVCFDEKNFLTTFTPFDDN